MSALTAIPPLFPLQYSQNFEYLAQQMPTQLSPFVKWDSFTGKSKDFQQMGKTAFQAQTGRALETRVTDIPMPKYRLSEGAYDNAVRFSEWDEHFLGQIVLPKSEVQMTQLYAWHRLVDLVIVTSALGNKIVPSVDSITGLESVTTVALPAGQKIAIDYVESGSAANSGLTIGKIRQAKFLLDDADNGQMGRRVIAITAKELQNLLRYTEVTNSDYAAVKALVQGDVNTFLGFTFAMVSSADVLPAVSGVRQLPVWIEGGVKGAQDGPKSYMDILPEHSHALQIRQSGLVGATRTEEVKVVQIAVDTTLA